MSISKVLIVGGGPAGLFLALRLVRLGIPTVVFEQESHFQPIPKALGYFGPSQFALQHAGIWEDVQSQGYLLEGLSWRKMTVETASDQKDWGDLIAEWNIAKSGPYPIGECGCGMTILGQDRLREILLKKLKESKLAEIYLGHSVIGLSQDEVSATVTVVDTLGEQHKFTGDYVVGADGGKSVTRKLLGLNLDGHTWPETLVATDTRVHIIPPGDGPAFVYLVDPVDWALFCPIENPSRTDPGYYRITVPMDPKECESADFEKYLHQKLERVIPGNRPLKYEVIRAQKYRIHQRIVAKMLSGRCMLIGDAAHLNCPWGGLGLTSGLLDGDSLADVLKLAMLEPEEDSKSLLQEWADARRNVFLSIVDPISSENKLRCHRTDPEDPKSDPFFKMLLKENNEEDLRAVFSGLSALATDTKQLLDKRN